MFEAKPATFDEALVQYTPMVHHLLKRLRIYKDFDDYIQLGFIALWEAYEKFDPEKGAFSAYAYMTMRGHLLTALKKQINYEEHHQPLNEQFLDVIEADMLKVPLEQEILSLYCRDLNKGEQTYIREHILNDRPLQDIADQHEVKLEAVKWWGRSAKKKLRRIAEALRDR
jgi:DNA-directed RNA polymerase